MILNMRNVLVILLFAVKSLASVNPCELSNSVRITEGTELEDGAITFENITYTKDKYFSFVTSKNRTEYRGCVCVIKTCARKCCPFGQVLSPEPAGPSSRCVYSSTKFEPPALIGGSIQKLSDPQARYGFLYRKPYCSPGRVRLPAQDIPDFYLEEDGGLHTEQETFSTEDYCLDVFQDNLTRPDEVLYRVFLCNKSDGPSTKELVDGICLLISCMFLLLTLAVYWWLPELRNLFGRVLTVYLACLLVAFTLLAALNIGLYCQVMDRERCTVLTFCIYFSLLASFFWLNVLCVEIYWTASGTNSSSLTSVKPFRWFLVYGFGSPAVLTALLLALEYSGLSGDLLPHMRTGGCFLTGNAKLIYLYGPMMILLFVNIVLFVVTWRRITTSIELGKEHEVRGQKQRDRKRFPLFVQLLVVSGVNWVCEVLSGFLPDVPVLWYITDGINSLLGIIIFIIFVCKKDIYNLIKKRLKSVKRQDPVHSIYPTIITEVMPLRKSDSAAR